MLSEYTNAFSLIPMRTLKIAVHDAVFLLQTYPKTSMSCLTILTNQLFICLLGILSAEYYTGDLFESDPACAYVPKAMLEE